jgi:hypothetical protein
MKFIFFYSQLSEYYYNHIYTNLNTIFDSKKSDTLDILININNKNKFIKNIEKEF